MKKHRHIGIQIKPKGEECNIGCKYCYQSKSSTGTIEKNDLIEFILGLLENDLTELSLSWFGGEVSLSPKDFIEDVCQSVSKFGDRVNIRIQTNLVSNVSRIEKLANEFNASISTSIDGPKDIHDKQRVTKRDKGTFELVMNGYHRLIHSGHSVDIICTLTKHSLENKERLLTFFQDLKPNSLRFSPMLDDSAIGISHKEYHDFLNWSFSYIVEHSLFNMHIQNIDSAISSIIGDHRNGGACGTDKCSDWYSIEPSGEIYECDYNVKKRKVGNIKNPINFQSSISSEIIDAISEPYDECSSCSVNNWCSGVCPELINRDLSFCESRRNHLTFINNILENYNERH